MPRGPIVLLRGTIQGMEREGECELLARRGLRGSFEYTDVTIISAPSDWPDGNYGVVFGGHFVVVKKTGGLWLTEGDSLRVE